MTRITATGPTRGRVAAALAVLVGAAAPAAAAESTPERFLAECQAGLAKLAERVRHCHGRYRIVEGTVGHDLQYIRDVEFAVSGDQWLLKTNRLEEQRGGKPVKVHEDQAVRAANPSYSFHIARRGEAGEYRLESYELAADVASDLLGGKIRRRMTFWLSPVQATHCIGFFPLVPLLQHPTFRLVKLTDGTRDGVPVVRAEFDSRPGEPPTDPGVSWTRGKVFGWFEVAPAEGWTVRAFEYTYFAAADKPEVPLAKARVIGEVGYAPGLDGLPVVARYKQSTAWLDKPPDSYIEMNDIQVAFGPTPADEFRLSHYGLPEPVGVAPPPKSAAPVYWWVLAAAGVFAAAALVLYRLARGRTLTQPTTSPGA